MMVAPTNSNILLVGEPGTGKKLLAKNIYEHSLRKFKPFVRINCSDISEEALESELFGIEKDSFTGKPIQSAGQLEMANGGVIFLEEIGDIPGSTQSKILRVLQKGEYERFGGRKSVKTDVRFIAATAKDLQKIVSDGNFIPELYYRINVFSVSLPPLRERKRDIPVLVDHFLQNSPKRVQISSAALQLLMAYGWPGNVRELKETITSSAAVCKNDIIEVNDLPQSIKEGPTQRVEAILQHAQRMESIGTIASGISHNFRNILSGIAINNQLVQMKYETDGKLQQITNSINSFVERGSHLVNELMMFSRKQPESRLESLNLSALLQEAYGLVKESFDKKISVRIDIADALPVAGSKSALSQVFMNLCTNARDALPDGGQISIKGVNKGDSAEISVSDTGIGMDEETQNKCFDPFFTTKDSGKGTGLGLSTTYGIIKNHGGDIRVKSEPGKGTTFLLTLPLEITKAAEEKKAVEGIVKGRGQKILIVDDEVDTLKPMEDMLESLGYLTASASSSDEAIEKYQAWRPSVVLMDRNMPEMDGMKTARIIVENDGKANIVLISGYEMDGIDGISEEDRQIIKDYLTKPIDIAELSRVLAEVLDKG
jgi:DNA-binding NtrC family response regulator/anti-sigma regulatory factor (Ser/Thr protein kinase)